jgi:ABC-type lipopolysaccharide export system ATPase subunit
VLIGLMGALLLYGAFHAPSRKLALVVAGASKIAFIALVLMQGDRYLSALQTALIIDAVMIVLDMQMVYGYFPRLKERTGLAGYLSGGEQQMLAIGRALMARPKLILMDEPSMGLSPMLVEEVFSIIRRLNKDLGVTILLVEQNAKVALKVADYGYIIEQGKIVLDGTSQDLATNEDVKEFYLGQGKNESRRSFRNLKSFKRRKRWI